MPKRLGLMTLNGKHLPRAGGQNADSETVMVDLAFWDDSFEQDRSRDDFGTTVSGIQGTHQNSIGSTMPLLCVFPRFDSKLCPF